MFPFFFTLFITLTQQLIDWTIFDGTSWQKNSHRGFSLLFYGRFFVLFANCLVEWNLCFDVRNTTASYGCFMANWWRWNGWKFPYVAKGGESGVDIVFLHIRKNPLKMNADNFVGVLEISIVKIDWNFVKMIECYDNWVKNSVRTVINFINFSKNRKNYKKISIPSWELIEIIH